MENKVVSVGFLVVLVMLAMVLPSSAQSGDILVGQAVIPVDMFASTELRTDEGSISWSTADVVIALDIAAGSREYDPTMDVNGDALITSLDAMMIMQAETGNSGIKIAGSTTVLPIAEECASAYMANNPGSQIDVSGGGSSYGVKAVANGTVDIGTASRDLKDSEIAAYPDLVTHTIARDGVAIVVNPANSVANLTMCDLQGIYTGTITNWVALGGNDATIVVVSREDGSGTRDCFEQAVLKPISGDITAGAVILDSNDAMRTEVSGNENAIGYLSIGYVNSDVKAVSLDTIEPTIENIGSGAYAISRTLLMITNGTPDEDEQSFLDFVLSDDGQQIVEGANFIPVASTLKIAGSTTVLPIAEECASAYMANNPGSQIDVSGGGSSYGVKAVANGTVDIGTASRDLKDSEIAAYPDLVTHTIARDGVAIVVNPANSVANLTMCDLQGIYTGTITNWADVGGTDSNITVVSREGGSGTRDCFEQAVLKPISGDITAGAVILDSNDAMRTEVSGNENAIGYLSLGYVDSNVSAVSLDGTLPTIENIGSGAYAISRTLLMITNGTPDEDEQSFLDFVLSDDGQQIVEGANFIPVASTLKIAGSTTVLPIAEECASAYMANNPGSQIDVSGGGSSYGVKAVANGTVDIGTASRDLKDSEIAAYPDLVTHTIARDGVAIVVNPANSVANLTMCDLQGIYTGTITNWADVGGTDSNITVVSREGGSGTRDCFEQAVLKPISGDITAGAVILDSNDAMRTEVSGNENAIGYLSIGYVNSDVKAVSLDTIEPTIENIGSGAYAISRTLLMITNGTPDEDEQSFLDFVLSDDGQQIVEDANFVSVR